MINLDLKEKKFIHLFLVQGLYGSDCHNRKAFELEPETGRRAVGRDK